ncbi:MAG: aldose epimerase family protein [Myxococcota bacterium]
MSPVSVNDPRLRFVTLRNDRGWSARWLTLGARLTSLVVPDPKGVPREVVLGYDSVEPYVAGTPWLGCVIGRYTNIIEDANYSIDGERYELRPNAGRHQMNGGRQGLHRVLWDVELTDDPAGPGVRFCHTSPPGAGGHPGELTVTVTWRLEHTDTVSVTFDATTTAPTHASLSAHPYFNLADDRRQTILNHLLQLGAPTYTPVRAGNIPTGEIRSLSGTEFDFASPTVIGSRRNGQYDQSFVLGHAGPAATLWDPGSGRRLTVTTSLPGLQLDTGTYLTERQRGAPRGFGAHGGVCLGAQALPNSPNIPAFPSTLLRPGQRLTAWIRYRLDHDPSLGSG